MRVILELNIEEAQVSAEYLGEIAGKAVAAISGAHGPHVHPRLLVEMAPNYLELPIPQSPTKIAR